MLTKLPNILNNSSYPLHKTAGTVGESFSQRLLHLQSKEECFVRSFVPKAIDSLTSALVGTDADFPKVPQDTLWTKYMSIS